MDSDHIFSAVMLIKCQRKETNDLHIISWNEYC